MIYVLETSNLSLSSVEDKQKLSVLDNKARSISVVSFIPSPFREALIYQ
ncbi:hypothetical protein ECH74042_B0055 (plasmid) [Escherichia coli O157:H7 str. EC4042]|nr:hypothetical protein ECH74042_B0055 [Escherichia coli O157:H7 str. EC4042]